MKRRDFIAASCLVGMAPLGKIAAVEDSCKASNKEYYELRLYRIASAEKRKLLGSFLAEAAVPAWNRLGIAPVGVFELLEEDSPNLYVLLPHKSLESVATVTARLMTDEDFLAAGADVLNSPKSDPAYQRIESSLLLAFDDFPKLETPSKKATRVFQLRTYESHNIERAKKKVEMFNAGGEIAIFRETGLTPVFFGESLVGSKLPNLTYMLGFDDKASGEKAWKRFLSAPGWLKLKKDPAYNDTVSNITNIFLRPAKGSQI